jgi:hypothetical protein
MGEQTGPRVLHYLWLYVLGGGINRLIAWRLDAKDMLHLLRLRSIGLLGERFREWNLSTVVVTYWKLNEEDESGYLWLYGL